MLESNFLFHKKHSYTHIKTQEEKEKEIAGLPKNIGPYEIIEKLKDGGYSKIYKAKSCYTGDLVAIKTIDKQCFHESVEDVLLMIRQTEVLKILKHRNLVSLYEIFESTKYFYLIMDYLPNGDLIEKIIKQKRFKEEEALNIFAQLVDALNYMHKNDICHRDIRTEKILFDKNNKPKLVGFSYSTFYTQGKKIRESYGSLCYACPEIIQNDYYYPELADVWSLGVVLYVMICGYLPFSEDDDEKNKELIINGEIDYPPEISNKVKDLLKHMLDINPNKRYNFQRIIKHPWFKPYSENTLTDGVNIYKMIYPVDERILKIIIIYGFKKNEIDMNLKQNKFNNGTGLYKQLTNKFLSMGFKSYSDLCSDDFMEFKKDKENLITDGDKKYKKYINKIIDKIKKVERYVNEYKRKEDKVVRDLKSIYDDAKNEEIKNKQKEKEINNVNALNNINDINNPKVFQRRTISPMLTVKEQKGIKDYLASKIGYIKKGNNNNIKTVNNNNHKNKDDDFDFLKDFKENEINEINEINNRFSFIEEDIDFNNKKLRRGQSNPNINEFVQKLLDKEENNTLLSSKNNDILDMDDIERPAKRKRQLSVMIKKKKRSYLNTSSINDSFLRRPKNEKERKRIIEKNLIKSINQVIIEENPNEGNLEKKSDEKKDYQNKNNNNIDEDNEVKNGEGKKGKNVKYSLSFGEDEIDSDEESGFISKIESKQVSMYDIDEELKELKDLKNNLKSPVCGPFLKQNTNDNKLLNFMIDNNSTIFGEHLDDNNITNITNATALANINEKIDILTQLKKLSEKNSTELAKTKYNDEKKVIETNQFQDDSFGQCQNYKKEFNPIVFDDKVEISFHDENNNNKSKDNNSNNNINNSNNFNGSNRNLPLYTSIHSSINHPSWGFNNNNSGNIANKEDIIYFYNDKKKIKNIYNKNILEEYILDISYIDLKRQNKYCYKYIKDLMLIKKINIFNNDLNISINLIESKRKKNQKNIKKENNNNKNLSKENHKNKISHSKTLKGKLSINKNLNKQKEKEKENIIINIFKIFFPFFFIYYIEKMVEIINKKTNKEKDKLRSLFKNENIQKTKEEVSANTIKSSNENKNNLTNSINNIFINDTLTNCINSNMNSIDKSDVINPLNNSQDNYFNCFNNNDNDKQKVYIIDNIDIENSTNFNESQNNNSNINNNIIINSNNNTINNISINNKNNYGNYFEQNLTTNNNYYNNENIQKNNKNNNKVNNNKYSNKSLDWSKLTNKFKNESKKDNNLFLSNIKDTNNSILSKNEDNNKNKNKNNCLLLNSYNNNVKYKPNKKTNNNIDNSISLTKNNSINKNNNKNNNYTMMKIRENQKTLPIDKSKKNIKSKKKKAHISIEQALHSNLMSNEYEDIEDKEELISKVKKGKKIYQIIVNDKTDIKKNNNIKKVNYNKFVNASEHKKNKNIVKRNKTNYVEQYHKRVNSNTTNNVSYNVNNINKRKLEENKDKHNHIKTKSDIVNYDYLFSIYNELNNNKNDKVIISSLQKNPKKFHSKYQSMDNSPRNSIKEKDISFGKNEFDNNFFFTNKNKSKNKNLRYIIGNEFENSE